MAPTPVGEMGMVEMTQALTLQDACFEQIGPDMLISGYLQPIPEPRVPATDELVSSSSTNWELPDVITFYKPWNTFGALSNFSPHPINVKDVEWRSVEHYYQAQKFSGVAEEQVRRIRGAQSPEEAARLGRSLAKHSPHLVRGDWEAVKLQVMYDALRCKFTQHPALRSLLLSTSTSILAEGSPHDLFWGAGRHGEGLNHLGRLLMKLRAHLAQHS